MAEKETPIAMPVVRRLPRYYRFFCDLRDSGVARISSRELAKRMGLTASQIRQDLNCFGEFGQQGYGYATERLCAELGHILGIGGSNGMVLIGAGNLGQALVNHIDFAGKGLPLLGIFDDAPTLIGTVLNGITIQSTASLEVFCDQKRPQAAVLCVPRCAAPQLVERLVNAGVRAFWNFSHYDILLDYPDVVVENVHLGDSLMTLSYLLKQQ